jgi:hypothetical protein
MYFILQGKKMWTVKLPKSITTIEVVDYKPKAFKAVLVALSNNEVHVYKVCLQNLPMSYRFLYCI